MQVQMWYPINMNSNLQNGISELARASRHRFADARALLREARWQGAMYIAGYAVECLLKTKLHIYGFLSWRKANDTDFRVISPNNVSNALRTTKKAIWRMSFRDVLFCQRTAQFLRIDWRFCSGLLRVGIG